MASQESGGVRPLLGLVRAVVKPLLAWCDGANLRGINTLSDTTNQTEATENTTNEQKQEETSSSVPSPAEVAEKTTSSEDKQADQRLAKVTAEAKSLRERATAAEKQAGTAADELKSLQSERDALIAERDEKNLRLARFDVAIKEKLPIEWAQRLRGTTEEELVEDAKQLGEMLAQNGWVPGGLPASGVVRGEDSVEETDLGKIGERIYR